MAVIYTPDFAAYGRLGAGGAMVPVYRTLLSDALTPVTAFARLTGGADACGFLFESVERGEKIGRYSFLGAGPRAAFKGYVGAGLRGKRREVSWEVRWADGEGQPVQHGTDDPLAAFETFARGPRAAVVPGLPRFAGGAVGYFAYDVVRLIERLPNRPPLPNYLEQVPDIYFLLFDTFVIFDHLKKTILVVSHTRPAPDGTPSRTLYDEACHRVDAVVGRLSRPGAAPLTDFPIQTRLARPFQSNFTRERFEAAVRRCQEYIRAGDIIQVVPSQRLSVETSANPFSLYRALRAINPSPYMFYLRFGAELQLVGSSPEVMVRVEDGTITVRPIAGTRRRGKTPEEDKALAEELLADPKERAEHVMLLDLGRNDVGRVAEFGTVKITEQMAIEYYSHVMHIVSNVEGKVRPGRSAFDVLRSCLPAGTLSGAPKVRAMEIIDELEPDARGPYGGAVGYLDFHGNLDTCIAIRTMVLTGGQAHVQAGAGIVADSVPESEYEETLSKARALLAAVEVAESFGE